MIQRTPGVAPVPSVRGDDVHDVPLVVESPAMRAVVGQLARAAEGRRHVLVWGEPGTDREAVAREIHRRGPGSQGPFIKVSYTSHSPEALELELFGCRTAGRTGTDRGRALERIARGGVLHQALGGSMFFEHLTEFPDKVQAKLARVLRDGEAAIVHEREPVVLDLRAIAAVEESYDQAVREGLVREDLHRLLSAVRINLPSVGNIREDIVGQARRFVQQACRRACVAPKALSQPAEQLLSALPWHRHSNTIELRDLMRNLVSQVSRDVIDLQDILNAVPLDRGTRPVAQGGSLREARERFERNYIKAALEMHHGRVPDAARTLGIQRTNLYRKLRQLKMTQNGT